MSSATASPRAAPSPAGLRALLAEVRSCRLCSEHLPLGPRPVLQVDGRARILVVGQAPGRRVHECGVPFQDPSGERLRDWMGIDAATFYDAARVALLPMGFCFPGTGRSGDLPPRPECATAWRAPLLAALPHVELTLVLGRYAVDYHLGDRQGASLTETVRAWRSFWPALLPLPHPSPRNNLWLRKNPWLEGEILPTLRSRVRALLG